MLSRRIAIIILFAIFSVLQYQLWFGKNGRKDVAAKYAQNQALYQSYVSQKKLNKTLLSEVKQLQNEGPLVEELARGQRGMIGNQEVFIQWQIKSTPVYSQSSSGPVVNSPVKK